MSQFDETRGVLDSTNPGYYPGLNKHIERNKEVLLESSNLKRFASTSSLPSKKSPHSFIPYFNNITAGHYPVCVNAYSNVTSEKNKPLIQVTVHPQSPQTAHKRRKHLPKKIAHANLTHSISNNDIYLLVPGAEIKKDQVYAIYSTELNDKIIKEVNFNNLLSKCILKSNITRDMNKNRKNNSDKETRETKPFPECSPYCQYMNFNDNKKNVDSDKSGSESQRSATRFNSKKKTVASDKSGSETPRSTTRFNGKKKYGDSDKSGSESPRSTTRSKYKVVESNTSISLKHKLTGKRPPRSRDRNTPKDVYNANSPTRSNRHQQKINFYQTESNEKGGTIKTPDRYSYVDDTRSIESLIAEAKRRSPERHDNRMPSPERPGRIRITGRLGLTKDDKCVLKCNATLDDKPIPTHFLGANCTQQLCVENCREECRSPINQRDAKVQARDMTKLSGAPPVSRSPIGMESQATQVDFQVFYSKNSANNISQKCACVNTVIVGEDKSTDNALKKHNNPVIVISVYPKNEVTAEVISDLKQKETITTMKKNENKKIGRSRSPSPAKTTNKTSSKKSETRINTSSSKKIFRESTRKETRSKSSRDGQRSRSRDKQSPSRNIVQSTTVTKSKTESKTSKSKTPKSQKTPPQSRRSKSPQNPVETKVTEQMIKKALIEDFTKNYTEQVTQRNTRLDIPLQTKHNVSNITIDIEGDSDYYNVRFAQDTGKTEFTVRKPTGKEPVTNSVTEENESTSLENFLYVKPDSEPRKRSFSQTLMFDGTDLIRDHALELEVKDSIEISHRRENASRPSLHSEDETNYLESKEVDTEYLAQMKHFQGDKCSVSDRHERDKEIRKLLGIDKIVETDPIKFRNSKTTLIARCSQTPNDAVIPLRLCICDRFSGTSQTNNSVSTLNDVDNYLTPIVNCVCLDQPTYQLFRNKDIQLHYRQTCHNRKPIVLTRRQYVNVKKTIYSTLILKQNPFFRAKWCNHHRKSCSSDSVVSERKKVILHYDKDTQTEQAKHANIQAHARNQAFDIRSDIYTIKEINNCGDGNRTRTEKRKSSSISSNETFEHSSYAKWTQRANHAMQFDKYMHDVQKTVLTCQVPNQPLNKCLKENSCRKSVSVKEIQCQTLAVTSVKFSSSDTADYRSRGNTVEINDSTSVHTIFKNRRTPVIPTPNLGTSAYSLCEGSEHLTSQLKIFEDSINHDVPRKPFLKKIMSCLVFNVFPTTKPQTPASQLKTHGPSSSFNSYHIGTSFGAIEMDSSLYDTTASFYSDHAIHPNFKTKRRFFDSFRVFFNRK